MNTNIKQETAEKEEKLEKEENNISADELKNLFTNFLTELKTLKEDINHIKQKQAAVVVENSINPKILEPTAEELLENRYIEISNRVKKGDDLLTDQEQFIYTLKNLGFTNEKIIEIVEDPDFSLI